MQGFTYDELFAALESWPEDDSSEYETDLPRIISLGELRLCRELNLEIFDIENESVAVTGNNRAVTKPAGLITTRSLFYSGGDGIKRPLYLRSRDFCHNYAPDPTELNPPKYYYEHSETQWRLVPTPNSNSTLLVNGVVRPTGLSEANQSTWFSLHTPDLLFDCCLMEAEHWIKADDRYEDIKKKFYEEKLPAARLELRNIIRSGEAYSPYKPSAQKAG